MATLPLAVDIVDAVFECCEEQRPLEPEATASRLADAHPEAGASREEILDMLREEGAATGGG